MKTMKMRRRRQAVGGRGGGGRSMVQVKVKKLQMLIPGGRRLKTDRLFLQTADYILQLRLQLNVLQALSKIYKL
ncbi:transcription factor PAR2-like [Malus sylvestris]|uniref:transcription factor PAR2-like n=1 Tax=Malus sylvestris TaxID=3752 RepID=UPI0021AD26A0|nr:transcription factor PAR2-like [Malus sylvestris]